MEKLVTYLPFIIVFWVYTFGFLYGFFNEMEDECVRNRFKKPFKLLFWTFSTKFLNSAEASNNKWKCGVDGKPLPSVKHWYHFGISPDYEEAFMYSSTIFVLFTDGEHRFQFLKNWMIILGTAPLALVSYWWLLFSWPLGFYSFTFTKEKLIKFMQ